ncbi:hypothetical protein [Clostridium tagluense]|uniref:hypothetical protein n=1 Tax=Clostridium tagluense TaxID=360422 RepID=UPI001CF23FC7|nr:hypothetical protein [Clostridium tagluense]MCB2300116.1 hypothetical protein [Clostridium tagluense]
MIYQRMQDATEKHELRVILACKNCNKVVFIKLKSKRGSGLISEFLFLMFLQMLQE